MDKEEKKNNLPPVPETEASLRIEAAFKELAEATRNHGCIFAITTSADTGAMHVAVSNRTPMLNGSLIADAILRFQETQDDGASIGASVYTAVILALALLINSEHTPVTEERVLADLRGALNNIKRPGVPATEDSAEPAPESPEPPAEPTPA